MSYEALGAQVFAASAIGSRIAPWWNVRQITPHGEVGRLERYPRRFAKPVEGNGPRPVATFYGRQIGPSGPTGPIRPLGGIVDEFREMALIQKLAVAGFFAVALYLAAAPIPKPERNPKRKFLGMSAKGERLWGELNPEDIRYYHVFANKDGKERYVGQVLDTGGAYFSVYPSGKQQIAHTAKEAAEALVGVSMRANKKAGRNPKRNPSTRLQKVGHPFPVPGSNKYHVLEKDWHRIGAVEKDKETGLWSATSDRIGGGKKDGFPSSKAAMKWVSSKAVRIKP
jgi:hypothetical protein